VYAGAEDAPAEGTTPEGAQGASVIRQFLMGMLVLAAVFAVEGLVIFCVEHPGVFAFAVR